MKNTLKVFPVDRKIVMDRTFAKLACDARSEEYSLLQRVRQDYPNYEVIIRHIRKNPNKKAYHGLTYEYMEDYILTHGPEEERLANYKKYAQMREIAECHGKAFRYPVIKSWFLEQYPEIAQYGICEETKFVEVGESKQVVVFSDAPQEQVA